MMLLFDFFHFHVARVVSVYVMRTDQQMNALLSSRAAYELLETFSNHPAHSSIFIVALEPLV